MAKQLVSNLRKIRKTKGKPWPEIPDDIFVPELWLGDDNSSIETITSAYKFQLEHGRYGNTGGYLFPFAFVYEIGSVMIYFINLNKSSTPTGRYACMRFYRATAYTSGHGTSELLYLKLIDDKEEKWTIPAPDDLVPV